MAAEKTPPALTEDQRTDLALEGYVDGLVTAWKTESDDLPAIEKSFKEFTEKGDAVFRAKLDRIFYERHLKRDTGYGFAHGWRGELSGGLYTHLNPKKARILKRRNYVQELAVRLLTPKQSTPPEEIIETMSEEGLAKKKRNPSSFTKV